MNVDGYLARTFHIKRSNCWHLVRDAWHELTGVDLGDRTPEQPSVVSLIGRFDSDVPAFTQLPGPADPSIVLMTRRGVIPHVGVFLRGRVLQMTSSGASFTPPALACVGFDQVRYYR